MGKLIPDEPIKGKRCFFHKWTLTARNLYFTYFMCQVCGKKKEIMT